jgi:hypothetical protein
MSELATAGDTTVVVPYVRNDRPSAQEFAPMVDVRLIGGYFVMDPKPALVDSGAERTSIPINWAELLGVDRADCREVNVHNVNVTRPGWVPRSRSRRSSLVIASR